MMKLDHAMLEGLRRSHPAWRLLVASNAPLIASFLQRVFVLPNVRVIAQADLLEMLADELYALRERFGAEVYPKLPQAYLNDWAANDTAWLRKFYPKGSDEPHFDLTPATEKAIAWLASLSERSFVGTESRLLTLFDLLKQICTGAEADPQARLAELYKQRAALDSEIVRIQGGHIPLLDDTAIRDRFQQFSGLARELLADFREVEHNFRGLDRRVRERIALWDGSKGALLEEIMGERDLIADSDQGKSFRAFWDLMMSQSRQDELTEMLDKVLQLAPISELKPDIRTRRVHYDWLEAGEHTQRTVALLSQQLRRFLDDQAYLENRRIMEIIQGIERHALSIRDDAPVGEFISVAESAAAIDLPMERPLYTPKIKTVLSAAALALGDGTQDDASALFGQFVIDKTRLTHNIRHALQSASQITLSQLLSSHPLEQGLAELIGYLQLAGDHPKTIIDDTINDTLVWATSDGGHKQAQLPRVIFVR